MGHSLMSTLTHLTSFLDLIGCLPIFSSIHFNACRSIRLLRLWSHKKPSTFMAISGWEGLVGDIKIPTVSMRACVRAYTSLRIDPHRHTRAHPRVLTRGCASICLLEPAKIMHSLLVGGLQALRTNTCCINHFPSLSHSIHLGPCLTLLGVGCFVYLAEPTAISSDAGAKIVESCVISYRAEGILPLSDYLQSHQRHRWKRCLS